MKKRILTSLLALATSGFMIFGLAACDSDNEHQHVWDDGEVVKVAKCYEMGEKKYTCTVKGCGETYTDDIPMIDHDWDDGEITTDPTCTTAGVRTKKCRAEGCGKTLPVSVNKVDHDWDDGELTVVPTLTSAGKIVYTCKFDCGTTDPVTVDPRADFSEQFYTSLAESTDWTYGYAEYDGDNLTFAQILATDEETPDIWKSGEVEIADGWVSGDGATIGYKFLQDIEIKISLKFDGDEDETVLSAYLILVRSGVTEEIAHLGGEDKEWEYETENSVTVAEGDKLYLVFSNESEGAASGSLKYTLTPVCQHVWDEGEETKATTCLEKDEITYTCTLGCGATKTEYGDYGPHDYDTEVWVDAEDGTHHGYKCNNCGDITNLTAHTMEDNGVKQPATNDEDGIMNTKCQDCGYESTRTLPALNHKQSDNYDYDINGHWFTCSEHEDEDCGVKFEEKPHAYDTEITAQRVEATCDADGYAVWQCVCGATEQRPLTNRPAHVWDEENYLHDASGHWFKCTECDETSTVEDHQWNDGNVTTEPTFPAEGVQETSCVCGETGTKSVPTKTSTTFASDFAVNDSGEFNGWEVGVVKYDWGTETFNFTKITTNNGTDDKVADAYNDNTDGWKEIKGDWMALNEMVGFAYQFNGTANIKVDFNLYDSSASATFFLRWAILDKDGNYKHDNRQAQWGTQGNTLEWTNTISVEDGDVLYLLVNREGEGDQCKFGITLTRVVSEEAVESLDMLPAKESWED